MIEINQLKEITQNFTVLYVEDEPALRERLSIIFRRFFKKVYTAENGEIGLQRYKEVKPDIVFSDIVMPRMTGLDMAEQIKKINRNQRIIIISAYNDLQYFLKAIRHGLDGFILKPVEMSQLFEMLEKTSKQIQQEQENIRYKKDLEAMVRQQTIELEKQLITDGLTGLFNRLKLDEILEKPDQYTLMLINLDNFGHINTTLGFEVGNLVLKDVSCFFSREIPQNATLIRLISDEFVVVFEKMSVSEAGDVASVILKKLYSHNINLHRGLTFRITATMALVEGQGKDLLQQAQIALIEARAISKNRVFVFDGESKMLEYQIQNIYWMNRVKKALESDSIQPFFQPIANNITGKIEKFECLARIVENGKVYSPEKFIEPANLIGLISQITRTMVRKSFEYFKNREYEFSINITDIDLKEDYLIDFLSEELKKTNLDPQRCIFEILEGVSVTGSDNILKRLNEIKSLGFKIAIDDFGAEQSNFSRLLDINADYIKIDAKFIKNIHIDHKSYTISKAIALLANNINTKVVAEYVHSENVFNLVKELGIDFSQGYYIGKPRASID